MAPLIGDATGISSQNMANSVLSSASASAQASSFMCFPVDSVVSDFLTNNAATPSITPVTIVNPLDSRATNILDALERSMRLQITISPAIETTSTEVDMASTGTRATSTIEATATAEQPAAVTASTGTESPGDQAGEAGAAKSAQSQSADPDPAKGPFPGGIPTPDEDVFVTVIFLVLFGLGAFTHISIFRANAKRGHKFLLSDLMFDFCMVRVLTCIFRIVWAFSSPRGVVLAAIIFQNGGAAVIFAVNLFLAQRLVRSMHPAFGWRPAFSYFSLFLIFSVPAAIIMNIIATAFSFFSVGKPTRLEASEGVLRVGASWNMMLVVMPLLWVFLASATANTSPEPFGIGNMARKGSLLVFTNPVAVEAMSPLFTKGAFYTTGFMLEILTVAAYAFFRIDLTFHIPNGASGPGAYSTHPNDGNTKPRSWTTDEVTREIDKIGVRYEILSSRRGGGGNKKGPVLALLHLDSTENDGSVDAEPEYEDQRRLRNARVSRRQSFMEAVMPKRPSRATTSTMYITEKPPASLYNE
ncbi:hypothetical protein BB8028_0005g01010 [Beauveria bassiana]|uniref:Uncharacterized protein n=1 Tax=Beauveria bassiana TaxID=176275 RepID=A0A2S7YEF5_BEABA|nr:hypothetical protein BB8028_0005g01010 [Beauveria bassiana]